MKVVETWGKYISLCGTKMLQEALKYRSIIKLAEPKNLFKKYTILDFLWNFPNEVLDLN